MSIKDFFGEFFGFNAEIERLNLLSANLKEELKTVSGLYNNCNKNSHVLRKKIISLKDEIEEQKERERKLEKLVLSLGGKIKPVNVPDAHITYKRPVWVGTSKKTEWSTAKIDIRNFIMPDYEMEKEIKKKNLFYEEDKDFDSLIPQLYNLARKNFKYEHDIDYGFVDFWMFPFELRKTLELGRAGDCDDWANMIGSYFATARIPRDRWLVSAGITRAGYGHATVYVKDSNGVWKHLNSTSYKKNRKDLADFPKNNDKKDYAGIQEKGFWFSYNDFYSIHKFESTTASKSFKKEKLPITIKVVR